ncbi:sulfotransferase domain-containing protein [Neptunicella sp. SCSIO 80796]|uniref:sulfotransferase domain-containing protein n=1 Tax=Neptunicella plasticusilytica TaxID=3117012 RepID=UPI003A4DB397
MEEASFPPKIYLLGSQKAGTTQLASYLDQHPDICLANPKEPDYYTQHHEKGLQWYQQKFSRQSRCLIDASTSYSCAPLPNYFPQDVGFKSAYADIPQRIFNTVPDARFIYIMRNPVQRAYSAYQHQIRAGLEHRSFDEAVAANSYYLRTGHYVGQIELYLEYFPRERFKFVFFEDLIQQPHAIVRDCFRFIGLQDDVALTDEVSQNKSFVYKGGFGRINQMIGRKGGINKLVKSVKPLIPKSVMHLMAKAMTEKPESMTENQKNRLTDYYSQPNELLKSMLGIKQLPWN